MLVIRFCVWDESQLPRHNIFPFFPFIIIFYLRCICYKAPEGELGIFFLLHFNAILLHSLTIFVCVTTQKFNVLY